jgi:hypothetical protein
MKRVVTEEVQDGGYVSDGGGGCVAFPVANGGSIDADLLRNVRLEEVEV